MVILKTPAQQPSFQEVVSRDRQKNWDSDEDVWTVDYIDLDDYLSGLSYLVHFL